MNDPTLPDNELRAALAGHAASVQPSFDPDRLHAAMIHRDRMRTVRTGLVAASVCVVVMLGVFATRAGEQSTSVDVVDQPDLSPAPLVDLPVLDDATDETSTTAPPTTAPPTTTPPTTPAPRSDPPAHLGDGATTTAAPAVVDTTTTAPPTTLPPPTTVPPTTAAPTTTTGAAIAFSASARYGTCEEDPPYDEYSGTASPGATIVVTSAWNSTATTTADAQGNWFVRVEFPSAPVGVTFPVTVSDGATSSTFDFTRTA